MKKFIPHIIAIGILAISCSTVSQDKNSNLKQFNDFLGQDKANALNSGVESFDQFLKTNFPGKELKRIKLFLEYLQKNLGPDSIWNLPTKRNKKIIAEFESSGLRKEIWVYGFEEYEPQYDIQKFRLLQ